MQLLATKLAVFEDERYIKDAPAFKVAFPIAFREDERSETVKHGAENMARASPNRDMAPGTGYYRKNPKSFGGTSPAQACSRKDRLRCASAPAR